MEKVRIGIIGLGNMGMNHLRVYLNTPKVDVIGLCDISKENVQRAAKFCKDAVVYSDYKQLLEQESLDAVSIVVPTKFHKEVALAALLAKKHILLEKPIAEDSKEAREIVFHVKQNGVKCLVGHIERFNPAVVELKKKIEENILGKIYAVNVTRIGLFPIGFVDAGVIKELAIHDLDIIQYLFESKVKQIFAATKKNICTPSHDLLLATLILENGIIAHLNVNWVSSVKKRELVITAEKGMLHLDYVNQKLSYYKQSTKQNLYTDDVLFKRKEGEVQVFEIDKKEPLILEIAHFVDCIIHNKPPIISAEDGLEVLEVAQRISSIVENERQE